MEGACRKARGSGRLPERQGRGPQRKARIGSRQSDGEDQDHRLQRPRHEAGEEEIQPVLARPEQGLGRSEAGAFAQQDQIRQEMEIRLFHKRRGEAHVLSAGGQPREQIGGFEELRVLRRAHGRQAGRPLRRPGPDIGGEGEDSEEDIEVLRGGLRGRRGRVLRLHQFLFRDPGRGRRRVQIVRRREEPQAGPDRRIRVAPGREGVSRQLRHLQREPKREDHPQAPAGARRRGDGGQDRRRRRRAEHPREQRGHTRQREELHLRAVDKVPVQEGVGAFRLLHLQGRHVPLRRQGGHVQILLDKGRQGPRGEADREVRSGQREVRERDDSQKARAHKEVLREAEQAQLRQLPGREAVHQEGPGGQEDRGGRRGRQRAAAERRVRKGSEIGGVLRLRHRHPRRDERERPGVHRRIEEIEIEVRAQDDTGDTGHRRQEGGHRGLLQGHEDRHEREADVRQEEGAHQRPSAHRLHRPGPDLVHQAQIQAVVHPPKAAGRPQGFRDLRGRNRRRDGVLRKAVLHGGDQRAHRKSGIGKALRHLRRKAGDEEADIPLEIDAHQIIPKENPIKFSIRLNNMGFYSL